MRSPEQRTWGSLKTRCLNPNSDQWALYGGRGIRVCDRWRNSFTAFLEDVGPRPSRDHTLDRIDANGHYEPGNVRWATARQQARNRSTNVILELGGERALLCEWAERYGLRVSALWLRLNRGWGLERALTTPLKGIGLRRRIDATVKDEIRSAYRAGSTMRALARQFGVSVQFVSNTVGGGGRGRRRGNGGRFIAVEALG